MGTLTDDQTTVQWFADVTGGRFTLIGDLLPVIPGGDFRRPTASFHKKKQEEIRIELLKAGKEPRQIEGSGRKPLEDEEILRDLESRPPPPPVLHQTFDDGAWSGLSGRQMHGTAVIQREVVRTGTRALQVSLKAGDDPRAQLRDPYSAPFGEETWYGFSVRLPVSFETNDSVVIAQWCDQVAPGQKSAKKPPMAIRYGKDGKIRITGDSGKPKEPARTDLCTIDVVEKDAWLDFKFKVTWLKSGDAKVTGFLNGEVIFQHEGPLGYAGRDLGPYFMFGLKTDSVPEGKPLTAYFDNYSHGQSGDVVDPPVQPKRASKEFMDAIADPPQSKRASKEFMDAIADPPEPEGASEELTETIAKKP